MPIRTVIERGRKEKKVAAAAIDWPGLSRGAKTSDEALDLLAAYCQRYLPSARHAGVEDHIRTAAEGFDLPELVLRSIVTPQMAQRPDVAVYVGYSDGRPVTTGLGIRTGRTIGVYNIATVPAVRRRGYGAQMTVRIMADGAAAGCDVAVLQSSDMGYTVYEHLGFRTVVEYMGYVDPACLGPA